MKASKLCRMAGPPRRWLLSRRRTNVDLRLNKGDLGGSTEILVPIDSTRLSLPVLLYPDPSRQQVLAGSVEGSGTAFNIFLRHQFPDIRPIVC